MECPVQGRCGACRYLGFDYSDQLSLKRKAVSDAFSSFGLKPSVQEVVGMEHPFNYRNKVISCVSAQGGRVVVGMYEEYSHRVVPVPECLLQDLALNELLSDIRDILESLNIRPYDCGGVLKNILLRVARSTGQIMVVFVTSEEMFHGRKDLVRRITSAHNEVKTIIQNVNPRQTSVVLGEKEMVLYGTGCIYDELLGHRFKLSASSFYQVNPLQTEKLYSKALSLAQIGRRDLVFDAYCGVGTIGISASEKASYVLGVEINPDAVRDARANARINHLRNTEFICSDVSEFMWGFEYRVDVLFLDPPRNGCDKRFLESVLRLAPERIVYISCDPRTQARDISFLKKCYHYADAYPFDMFPHTEHVENIVPLLRK